MNKHDSERIAGLLESTGFSLSSDISSADLVVYYTCCVRESADDRFYGQLSSTKYKMGAKIAVGGCLAQKEQEKLLKRCKNVDLVFGTQNLSDLPQLINQLNGASLANTQMLKDFNSDLPSKREDSFKAWVAVNRGCDNHCTYCIVPSVRGGEVSRPMEDVFNEVKALVDDGVLEVCLLGQNVNSYGKDIYGQPSFAKLLEKLSSTGVARLRFTTSHPKDLTQGIVKIISRNENICNHIHLPMQAGSNVILKKMGRRYTKEHYLSLIDMIRGNLPDCSISTDIMVGFPTETEEDFCHTLDLVEKAQFDQAFMFIYSKREGTAAAKMADQLDYETKLDRFKRLVELQTDIGHRKNKTFEGKTVELLVDGVTKKDKTVLSGRTKNNKLVHFKGDEALTGKFVKVKIIKAKPFYLAGEIS